MTMKILNLYCGIGGNRQLWYGDIDVTAVEIIPEIASIYQKYYPNDRIIIGDAHQFLLDNFKEYDFIWSSPPCPTHSVINFLLNEKVEQGITPKYPDMKLYEEIILLKTWFNGDYIVENVISYYEPLIKPYKSGKHYFWSNHIISEYNKNIKRGTIGRPGCDINFVLTKNHININDLNEIKGKGMKRKVLNNCVEPELGLFVFNSIFNKKQITF